MTLPVYRTARATPTATALPPWHSALALATGVIRLCCNACRRLADVNTSTDFEGGPAPTKGMNRGER